MFQLKLIPAGMNTERELTALSEKDDEITYVIGQRGSRKIVCGGHSYICAKVNGDRKYWVCAKQRSKNCKARLITNKDETNLVIRNEQHNHQSEHSTSRSKAN